MAGHCGVHGVRVRVSHGAVAGEARFDITDEFRHVDRTNRLGRRVLRRFHRENREASHIFGNPPAPKRVRRSWGVAQLRAAGPRRVAVPGALGSGESGVRD